MIHIILFQPEIPPNTGNIIRLCANTGAHLHLIEPLGFALEDRQLRRAGLDYHEWARVMVWPNLAACLQKVEPSRCFAISTKAQQSVYDCQFTANDALLFGSETAGLPDSIRQQFAGLTLPMREGRSLNLSNAVAITVYEAWRQLGFAHLA